jgi:hypothetical protein
MLSRTGEMGDIGARYQAHSQLRAVFLVAIVHGKSLAEFYGCRSHYMIQIRIVGRISSEDFHTNGSLFNLTRRAVQRLLDHIAKELNGALARAEDRILNHGFKLFANRLRRKLGDADSFGFRDGHMLPVGIILDLRFRAVHCEPSVAGSLQTMAGRLSYTRQERTFSRA